MVGNDKPGLIDSIANIISAAEGNWLASSFAHMAGHFAGFAEISIEEAQQETLLAALKNHPDLEITLSHGVEKQIQETQRISVNVEANDRPGIVKQLSGVLNQFDINIVQFDSACHSAPNWGNPIFRATAEVELPEGFDSNELQSSLEALSDDVMVDIKL